MSVPKGWRRRKWKSEADCVKNFDAKKGGKFTCIGCPEEKNCEYLNRMRNFVEEKLG